MTDRKHLYPAGNNGNVYQVCEPFTLHGVKIPFGVSKYDTLTGNLTKENVAIINRKAEEVYEDFHELIKASNYGPTCYFKIDKKMKPEISDELKLGKAVFDLVIIATVYVVDKVDKFSFTIVNGRRSKIQTVEEDREEFAFDD